MRTQKPLPLSLSPLRRSRSLLTKATIVHIWEGRLTNLFLSGLWRTCRTTCFWIHTPREELFERVRSFQDTLEELCIKEHPTADGSMHPDHRRDLRRLLSQYYEQLSKGVEPGSASACVPASASVRRRRRRWPSPYPAPHPRCGGRRGRGHEPGPAPPASPLVWLILTGVSSSGLNFAEPDEIDLGYPGAIPRMSCPSLAQDIRGPNQRRIIFMNPG